MNFKIGIDGGGTKTEFILVDSAGAIVARRLTRGCNPSLIDHDIIRAILSDNLGSLAAEARARDADATITHTLLCMAGNRGFWRELGASLQQFGTVQTFDDSLPVLELATGGAAGIVLHCGTGSFVAARGRDDGIHFAGGLGWRLGDPGSAHDLGRRAVARTELELQGWADRSPIGQAVCAATGIHDASALSRHFYAPTTPDAAVADFAPRVTAAAADGDPVAAEIITQSIAGLGNLATTVLDRVFGVPVSKNVPCGLSGSILQTPTALATLVKSIGPRVSFLPIAETPIEGVRRMLVRL